MHLLHKCENAFQMRETFKGKFQTLCVEVVVRG